MILVILFLQFTRVANDCELLEFEVVGSIIREEIFTRNWQKYQSQEK
jgi:hypothetical protein